MNKKIILIIIVGIIAAGIVGASLLLKRNQGTQANVTPTPIQAEPTEEPTPIPEANTDVASYKVKVLNGTAIAGLAAKVQTQLQSAGFTISSIGNADKKDYQQVVIQAKTTVASVVIDKLKEALGKTYTVGSQDTLEDASEDDIIVILGVKSAPQPTPTTKQSGPTPTSSTNSTPSPSQTTITPTPTQ